MRSLWFLVGFLTGVVSTGLGLLWMMARAVAAGRRRRMGARPKASGRAAAGIPVKEEAVPV